ncbi:MAG: hypothetical protein ACOX0H_02745 [Patescibacteria group bacterium]|jgi:hypothetical protein|nr:hypothetical protein [bacterium]HQC50162.1 hypothetical protein [bacterium]
MPRIIIKNKNIKSPARTSSAARGLSNDNSMKKEYVFPLIVGLIFGVLAMIFWQFTARLNVQNTRLAQLEQITNQNTQSVNDIIAFINQATAGTGTETPAVTD